MSGPLNEAGERWDDDYGLDPRATTTPQLSEAEVAEIEARAGAATDPYSQGAQAYIDALVTLVRVDIPALIRDWRALRAERDAAMAVLAPSMPESGLEDACRQLKQACMSEADNCEALEQINMRLSTGLVNIYHVITGEACPHGVALGMATSAVSSLKSENAALREQMAQERQRVIGIIETKRRGSTERYAYGGYSREPWRLNAETLQTICKELLKEVADDALAANTAGDCLGDSARLDAGTVHKTEG